MDKVTLFEMGPRDGLQNEKKLIDTTDKIKLVDLLSECGFSKIEVTSFVSPKWVPQMADAADVLAGIHRNPAIAYAALTPNLRGYDGAKAARADEVAIFASASEGFSQKNINCSIDESLERFAPVLAAAKADNIPVRGYVSCVTDCPYDGPTPPENTARIAKALYDMGCYEISLGDTIGAATPETTSLMLQAVQQVVPIAKLAGHFHDTHARALDNIEVCLGYGLRTFDAAVGGLGGCPYAPGAKGNVATEKVATLLHSKGFATGLDLEKLAKASQFAQNLKG
ncbi:hydroxymethylglutaryl-CoA lyase [Maritalea myrionectae]|uniref:hydroxymethylglutaryl-CoA lyase n=1 Tax=Maritalea myrionectae TaxID=454601 RepID=A0A2R4M9N9_9HYPH|nr:hydroxymethylglutaryl-CoA lyase [Maritalea myrionectae]AVX02644.1 hydroxymethylglutaryl-CoA lyase [Maritalea myrionectae]